MQIASNGLGQAEAAIEAEAWVLTSDAGSRLLGEVAALRSILPVDLARLQRSAPAAAVAAAIRLTTARAKGAAKFERCAQMWLEPTAVEQATSEPVARHKAGRFRCPLVVDLCAGIGGDALALAAEHNVLAVDLDRGMCRRLQFNAAVYHVADRILSIQARAENFAFPPSAWVHLDPDRRTVGSKRASSLDDYVPPPAFWDALSRRAPGGAIKLSPASDFATHFKDTEHEVELVSLRGECKEATVWWGEAATCRRRATRLPENVTWTDRDGPTGAWAPAGPLGGVIYDPDPSLLRAGLLDGFALAHELRRAGDGVDYLTSNQLLSTPFLSAFEVRDVSAFDLRRVRRMLAAHNVGSLVIKVRGLRLTPEKLRADLRLRGSQEATLIVIGGAGGARAVLVQRISSGGSIASSTAGPATAGGSASTAAEVGADADADPGAAAGTDAGSPTPLPSA